MEFCILSNNNDHPVIYEYIFPLVTLQQYANEKGYDLISKMFDASQEA